VAKVARVLACGVVLAALTGQASAQTGEAKADGGHNPRDLEGLWWPVMPQLPGGPPKPGEPPPIAPPPGGVAGLAGPALGGGATEEAEGSTLQCAPVFRLVGAGGGMSNLWVQSDTEIVMISEEGMDLARQIYLRGAHPSDLTPQPNGHSIGRWDGDVLVVDTIGFSKSNGEASDRHVVERFKKHGDDLVDEATVTEDGKTARTTLHARRRPDMHVWESVCEEGYQRFELRDGKVFDIGVPAEPKG
jgi:hypothetical protein